MELLFWGIIVALVVILIGILISWYKIVPADCADVAIQGGKIRVFSSHKEYSPDGQSSYFSIPSWFFFFKKGMKVHRIPLRIIPVNVKDFLAFDKDRARFVCNIVAYIVVKSPIEAAKRFSGNMEELKIQVSQIIQGTTRDATTKNPIREIINDRDLIMKQVGPILTQAISHWGLELKNVELVEFRDPRPEEYKDQKGQSSEVIANISSIIETQIHSEARQKNAEQLKIARTKEAEAEEIAKKREIEKDEKIGIRKQEQEREVFLKEKEAREASLDVTRVQQVKTQQIEKEKMIVEANQRKEIEEINKKQKELEGQGDRLKAEEQAKGDAAPILEKLLAEAKGKDELQKALNRFEDKAIRALVAEKIVEMQKTVGVEGAKALAGADLKVFSGGGDTSGFDLGKLIESIRVANDDVAAAVANKIARPNDLGVVALGKMLGDKKE